MRGGASDLVPGAFGPCSFFGACLAFATTAPPFCARARKARRSGGRSKRARRTRERCAWSVSAGRMLVEADQGPVRPLVFLVYPHHDRLNHLTLLDLAARLGGLDRRGDDVADVGVLAVVAAGHADDQELLCP